MQFLNNESNKSQVLDVNEAKNKINQLAKNSVLTIKIEQLNLSSVSKIISSCEDAHFNIRFVTIDIK